MRELDYCQSEMHEKEFNIFESLLDHFFEIAPHYKNIEQFFDNFENPDIPGESMLNTIVRYQEIKEKITDLSGLVYEFKKLIDMLEEDKLVFQKIINEIINEGRAAFKKSNYLKKSTFL
jgi:hypothetical protein